MLAENISTSVPLPGFDNSAMDGYAVRAIDTRDASLENPVVLPVIGDIAAGATSRAGMGPGLAMRIMTGAPIPAGADGVIPLEDTDRGVAKVAIHRPVRAGECIRTRRRGHHHRRAPRWARAPRSARSRSRCSRRSAATGCSSAHARVSWSSAPAANWSRSGRRPNFGEVSDANSYLLAAAAKDAGADSHRYGIVPDDHSALLDVLESQLLRADILVTSGGVSMGAFDVVKEALSELGTVEFTKIAMQPGQAAGLRASGQQGADLLPARQPGQLAGLVRGLRPSGDPQAARQAHPPPRDRAGGGARDRSTARRECGSIRRGILHREATGGYSVSLVGGPGSHLIAAMAAANCLVVIDEEVTEVVAGSRVTVMPLLLSNR